MRLRTLRTGDFVGTAVAAQGPGSSLPAEILKGYAVKDLLKELRCSGENYTVVEDAKIYEKVSKKPSFFHLRVLRCQEHSTTSNPKVATFGI